MPDMHALEMIPWMRSEHPGMPILVVSAFKGMENDFNLRENHIDGFFAKPVNMELLKKKIGEILSARLAHHAA
jgi:DNA-binding response OmpR family regulator